MCGRVYIPVRDVEVDGGRPFDPVLPATPGIARVDPEEDARPDTACGKETSDSNVPATVDIEDWESMEERRFRFCRAGTVVGRLGWTAEREDGRVLIIGLMVGSGMETVAGMVTGGWAVIGVGMSKGGRGIGIYGSGGMGLSDVRRYERRLERSFSDPEAEVSDVGRVVFALAVAFAFAAAAAA